MRKIERAKWRITSQGRMPRFQTRGREKLHLPSFLLISKHKYFVPKNFIRQIMDDDDTISSV